MRRIVFIIVALLIVGGATSEISAQGFLGGVVNKAKEKVKEKMEQKEEDKVSAATDDVLDGKIGKSKKGKKNGDSDETSAYESSSSNSNAKSKYAKSDFVRGGQVFFTDDFEGEQMGEVPSKWDVKDGNIEIAHVGGSKCLVFSGEYNEAMPLMKNPNRYLDDVFTIEFDFWLDEPNTDDISYEFQGRSADDGALTWEIDLNTYDFDSKLGCVWIVDKPDDSAVRGNIDNISSDMPAWHHFAISFNQRALKIYVDGTRVASLPNIFKPDNYFIVGRSKGLAIDNVVMAKGAVALYAQNATDKDAVTKAIEETGKFVTNNILFVTGKADLKPESMAEIEKVANYMKKNPAVRFEIQGHTDNQGSDKINDPLSQKRAESVVSALERLGVDVFNLRAVGKGSHEPVADNKTEEGRAKNRRVEFIKK